MTKLRTQSLGSLGKQTSKSLLCDSRRVARVGDDSNQAIRIPDPSQGSLRENGKGPKSEADSISTLVSTRPPVLALDGEQKLEP